LLRTDTFLNHVLVGQPCFVADTNELLLAPLLPLPGEDFAAAALLHIVSTDTPVGWNVKLWSSVNIPAGHFIPREANGVLD
jgi:hypothetical protein